MVVAVLFSPLKILLPPPIKQPVYRSYREKVIVVVVEMKTKDKDSLGEILIYCAV